MVKGLAAVDWKKPENNAKLFAAVLAMIPGTPDYKKIAAVFGPNVPGNAISYRLGVVRKEGAALGFTPGSGSFSAPTSSNRMTTTKRALPAAKKNTSKGEGRKSKHFLIDDDPSDDAETSVDSVEEMNTTEMDDEQLPTIPAHSAKLQKTLSGRITKRVFPRKGSKTNYKNLEDPFVMMDNAKDEDGNNVFGEPSATESEDTYATDGSYKEDGKVAIKMEEDVA